MKSEFFVTPLYLRKVDLVGLLQVVRVGDDEGVGWDILNSDGILRLSANHMLVSFINGVDLDIRIVSRRSIAFLVNLLGKELPISTFN